MVERCLGGSVIGPVANSAAGHHLDETVCAKPIFKLCLRLRHSFRVHFDCRQPIGESIQIPYELTYAQGKVAT